MSYEIATRIIQKDPAQWFSIVEKTVGHFPTGGIWLECDGLQKLSVPGDNGWSGTLRFANPKGEYFLVALGIHNNKPWCDIVPDLSASNTCVQIHPQYYGGERSDVPQSQKSKDEKKTSKAATITVNITKGDTITKDNDHKFSTTITKGVTDTKGNDNKFSATVTIIY